MTLKRPSLLATLMLSEFLLISGENDASDDYSADYYKDVCKRFNAYYRRQFPEAQRSPCEVLYDYPSFAEQFKEYMETYQINYNSSTERRIRFANFAANLVYMLEMGKKEAAFTMAVNGFADMSPEEFRETHLGLNETRPMLGAEPPTGQEVPSSLDWVELGGVTVPVNQGSCNSCWTFATTGALEGAWFHLTGQLVALSEQQFLECTGGKLGCKYGGNLESPYKKVATRYPVCTEDSYPYTGEQGTCHQSSCSTAIPLGAIIGFKAVKSNDEQALKEALTNVGPVAVGIDASGNEVMFYSSGVLTAPCSDRLNHAVLVVGYGVQEPHLYWKVKNSWGVRWGEGGFFRLLRGLDGSGECGIKAIPTVPDMTMAGVTVPTDVAPATPASLGGSQGFIHNSFILLGLTVLAGVAVGGCVFMIFCQCCFGGAKTRGADVDPLYSPVCMHDSASSDDDMQAYGHHPH